MIGNKLSYNPCLLLLIVSVLFLNVQLIAQTSSIKEIQDAVDNNNFEQAKEILHKSLDRFTSEGRFDSIVNYIYWTGKIYAGQHDGQAGSREVGKLLNQLKIAGIPDSLLSEAYINAGDYYGYIGDAKQGYRCNQMAFQYAQKANSTPNQLAKIQSNMATFSQRNGEIGLMTEHAREMIRLLNTALETDYVELYFAENMLGNSMYYQSKLDSAAYYYGRAIQTVKKADPTPKNQFYRVALLQNNISAIYSMQGNVQQAIDTMYGVIKNLEEYNRLEKEAEQRSRAYRLQFEAIDNLASIYKDLGNLTRAKELLEYSYQQKKANLSPGNRGVFNSEILLGQLYHALRKDQQAEKHIRSGLKNYKENDINDPLWTADGYYTLALLYDGKKDFDRAETHYQKADSLYDVGISWGYDPMYLDFLGNRSKFYAENGHYKEAREISERSMNYVNDAQGRESLASFYQILNRSEIEYHAAQYENALRYADEGLDLIRKKTAGAETLRDSIKMELHIPKAILYKVQSKYLLNSRTDEEYITALLNELYEAVDIIERKKNLIEAQENNRILLAEHKELFELIKELELKRYQLTGDRQSLQNLINVQESVLYSKIRDRLREDDVMQYAHIPEEIRDKEKDLYNGIGQALNEAQSFKAIQQFGQKLDKMRDFQQMIKREYPEYYNLKYRSLLNEPLEYANLAKPNTTILRYFFIGTELYVLIVDNQTEEVFRLESKDLERSISIIHNPGTKSKVVLKALSDLYQNLWEPFSDKIKNKKITVIPDGILYNLNLEMLVPELLDSFEEFAEKSLLSQYTFSYQYGFHTLGRKAAQQTKSQWVGYAPGFEDHTKSRYIRSVQDSVRLDQHYTKLMPQPFTTDLVQKIAKRMKGKSYLGLASTKREFLNSSAQASILHIGSHAFANNENPQYSHIVFAKDTAENEDNNLYVHDIYGFDLPAELTLLSACETGKPGYEDGEGMISLAHAFYYAGSRSIVTNLWNADEKSTNMILGHFYEFLNEGMAKDEALRKAKLAYLNTEEGRVLSPLYWSGTIIMGDTLPMDIALDTAGIWRTWYLWIVFIILILFGVVFQKRKSS